VNSRARSRQALRLPEPWPADGRSPTLPWRFSRTRQESGKKRSAPENRELTRSGLRPKRGHPDGVDRLGSRRFEVGLGSQRGRNLIQPGLVSVLLQCVEVGAPGSHHKNSHHEEFVQDLHRQSSRDELPLDCTSFKEFLGLRPYLQSSCDPTLAQHPWRPTRQRVWRSRVTQRCPRGSASGVMIAVRNSQSPHFFDSARGRALDFEGLKFLEQKSGGYPGESAPVDARSKEKQSQRTWPRYGPASVNSRS
jgi:hypothetical protein